MVAGVGFDQRPLGYVPFSNPHRSQGRVGPYSPDVGGVGEEWLRAIKREDAFEQMNMKLQPGAMKYYREVGMEIPKELL